MKKKGAGRHSMLWVALISVALGLLIGAIVIAVLGKNPFTAYYNLLQGSGLAPKAKYAGGKSMLTDFSSYVDYWTPMIFAALAVAVAMKAGLFNIGVSGQMLAAAFVTTVTVGYSTLAAPLAKPLALAVGLLTGAAVGALIGFFKYKFNINEVVSSIMLNYIAQYVIAFFINTFFVNPVSRQSEEVSAASRLTLHQIAIGGYKYDLPLGFLAAVAAVALVWFLFEKTVFGYELKAIGANREAARYAGIKVGRGIVLSMAISGALAGLAGVTYFLGYFASIQPRVLPDTGFDAIAVCLLGGSNPAGIVVASFLIQIIDKGATYMSSQAGLESEIAAVITGVILLSSACGVFYQTIGRRLQAKRRAAREQKGGAAHE